MKRVWKHILVGMLGIAIVDCLAVGVFFNLAAGRTCAFYKRGKKKKNGKSENEDKLSARYAGISWMEGQICEQAEIISEDGLKLAAQYLEAENPKRILLLFHGWRGSWQHDFGACLRTLHDKGSSILLVDQRAQGKSEGRYMGFGVLEKNDCHIWLNWTSKRNPEHLPVYLYGVSMGASTVLMVAGEKLPAEVKGVIADCGFTIPYEMVLQYGMQKMKMKEQPLMKQLDWVFRIKAGYSLKDASTLDAMRRCILPILFIHGKADTFVPYKMTVENYEACNSRKKLLLVEGADHCMSFLEAPKEYMEELDELFGLCEDRNI